MFHRIRHVPYPCIKYIWLLDRFFLSKAILNKRDMIALDCSPESYVQMKVYEMKGAPPGCPVYLFTNSGGHRAQQNVFNTSITEGHLK